MPFWNLSHVWNSVDPDQTASEGFTMFVQTRLSKYLGSLKVLNWGERFNF